MEGKIFRVNSVVGLLGYLNVWPVSRVVLNQRVEDGQELIPSFQTAVELAEELRKCILKLYGRFLSAAGGCVDYDGLSSSAEFKEYVRLSVSLDGVRLNELCGNAAQCTAFFINLYNSLVIHAIVVLGRPGDLLSRVRLYATASYSVGGLVLSLNDIENGVLRGNRPAPTPFARAPLSGEAAARLGLAPAAPADPRVHAALNCGARGCPPIRFYSADSLHTQLETAVRSFCCSGGVTVDASARRVTLSRIFQWYAADFAAAASAQYASDVANAVPPRRRGGCSGVEKAVLRWVLPYLDLSDQRALAGLLGLPVPNTEQPIKLGDGGEVGSVQVVYAEYDWNLNH